MSECYSGVALARFVDGECDAAERACIGGHQATCARCRATVEELREIIGTLARDPEPPATSLDLAPLVLQRAALPQPRHRPRVLQTFAVAAAAAAGLVVGINLSQHSTGGRDSAASEGAGFQARGGADTPDEWVAIHAFVEGGEGGAKPRALAGHMGSGDALLFAYDNGGPHPYGYLAVFAVDAAGALHWFFPEGELAGAASIAIAPGTGHELQVSIRPEMAPGRAVIYGLFSERPIAVAEVERVVERRTSSWVAAGAARLPFAGTGQHRLEVAVGAE